MRDVRLAALVALGLTVLAAAVVVAFPSARTYTVHARFVDASQLVEGARVEVGGRQVGSVRRIGLSDDGQADVELALTEDEVQPLHRGTVAAIRAVGLSGVANRFVDLSPGPPKAPAIPEGGLLTAEETRPIVDLDAVLDTFDPATRGRLQQLLERSSVAFGGGAARDANRALGALDPAVSQLRGLSEELTRDTAAVGRLVSTGATVAQTLANRGDAVERSLASTATTLEAVAGERRALAAGLRRTPAVLRRTQRTLTRLDAALAQLRPAFRELRPVAGPLRTVLERLAPTARDTAPALRRLNALLPALDTAADGLPALDRRAQPALKTTTKAIGDSLPVFDQLRIFAPDVIHGALIGIGGPTAALYDATGHTARFSPLTAVRGRGTFERGNLRRCPGGAADPTPDGSAPWIPDPSICTPEHDVGHHTP